MIVHLTLWKDASFNMCLFRSSSTIFFNDQCRAFVFNIHEYHQKTCRYFFSTWYLAIFVTFLGWLSDLYDTSPSHDNIGIIYENHALQHISLALWRVSSFQFVVIPRHWNTRAHQQEQGRQWQEFRRRPKLSKCLTQCLVDKITVMVIPPSIIGFLRGGGDSPNLP